MAPATRPPRLLSTILDGLPYRNVTLVPGRAIPFCQRHPTTVRSRAHRRSRPANFRMQGKTPGWIIPTTETLPVLPLHRSRQHCRQEIPPKLWSTPLYVAGTFCTSNCGVLARDRLLRNEWLHTGTRLDTLLVWPLSSLLSVQWRSGTPLPLRAVNNLQAASARLGWSALVS